MLRAVPSKIPLGLHAKIVFVTHFCALFKVRQQINGIFYGKSNETFA